MTPRIALVLALAAPAAWAAAQSPADYWERYGGQPVNINQANQGRSQNLRFVDYDNGNLVARVPQDQGGGQISLPVSTSMAENLRFEYDEKSRVDRLEGDGKHAQAVEVLRPVAYPLVKFAPLPKEAYQIHVPVQALLRNLIAGGMLEEASALFGRIPLGESPPAYSGLAVDLARQYADQGEFARVGELARSLPVQPPYSGNIGAVMDLAGKLRGAERYGDVIPLYRSLQDAVPENRRRNIRVWLAYSLVLADRLDEAKKLVDEIEPPARDHRLFSLYKLLQGSRLHRLGEYAEALDTLSRGFVKGESANPWIPEMLFLIGDCYARTEAHTAARNVWKEITLLYRDSPWAEKAEERIAELPESQA